MITNKKKQRRLKLTFHWFTSTAGGNSFVIKRNKNLYYICYIIGVIENNKYFLFIFERDKHGLLDLLQFENHIILNLINISYKIYWMTNTWVLVFWLYHSSSVNEGERKTLSLTISFIFQNC